MKESKELTLHVGAPVDPGVATAKKQVLDEFAAVTAAKKTVAGGGGPSGPSRAA